MIDPEKKYLFVPNPSSSVLVGAIFYLQEQPERSTGNKYYLPKSSKLIYVYDVIGEKFAERVLRGFDYPHTQFKTAKEIIREILEGEFKNR